MSSESARGGVIETKGFFSSLFDYSFSSYITPRIIKVLYVLATIIVALWTLLIVLAAFKASSGLGILALLIFGPICFVISMIWARVGLEFISAFFRIHDDVQRISQRAGGSGGTPEAAVLPTPKPGPAPAPVAEPSDGPASPPETPQEPAVTANVAEPSSEVAPAASSSSAIEPSTPAPVARFCDNCGAERSPGKRFCASCGKPLE